MATLSTPIPPFSLSHLGRFFGCILRAGLTGKWFAPSKVLLTLSLHCSTVVTLTVIHRHRYGESMESLLCLCHCLLSLWLITGLARAHLGLFVCCCMTHPNQKLAGQAMVVGELGTGNHNPKAAPLLATPTVFV